MYIYQKVVLRKSCCSLYGMLVSCIQNVYKVLSVNETLRRNTVENGNYETQASVTNL